MIATHQAWGENDCYEDKESVKHKCSTSIATHDDHYIHPGRECCLRCEKKSDLVCLNLDYEFEASALRASACRRQNECCHHCSRSTTWFFYPWLYPGGAA
jgi:hypothetical protein